MDSEAPRVKENAAKLTKLSWQATENQRFDRLSETIDSARKNKRATCSVPSRLATDDSVLGAVMNDLT